MPDRTGTIIENVTYCGYQFKPWYPSPGYFEDGNSRVPGPNSSLWAKYKESREEKPVVTLHICDYCFKYSVDEEKLVCHKCICPHTLHPPGTVVYNDQEYKIYEIDGREHKLFCQCLCLFGKLFLESKSIYYTVQDFQFFLLVEAVGSQRIAGFFSREKLSWDDCNLACLLVFPPFQKRGLGRLLIAFSYQLSLAANKLGSPERPLSDHGLASYRAYWVIAISQAVLHCNSSTITFDQISRQTGIDQSDVMETLDYMGALKREDSRMSVLVGTIRHFVNLNHISLKPIINKKNCLF